MSRSPQVTVPVNGITIHMGETLNVWLTSKGIITQVELRVLPNGTHQVFLNDKSLVQSFGSWQPMEAYDEQGS